MNPFDHDDDYRNKETKAFDPPLIYEKEIEHATTDDEEEESEKKPESPEVDENKESKGKTGVVTKEALIGVASGQL